MVLLLNKRRQQYVEYHHRLERRHQIQKFVQSMNIIIEPVGKVFSFCKGSCLFYIRFCSCFQLLGRRRELAVDSILDPLANLLHGF